MLLGQFVAAAAQALLRERAHCCVRCCSPGKGSGVAAVLHSLMGVALLLFSLPQVSEQGEVVYAFERDFVSAISRRSWLQRLRPLWKKVVSGVNYLTRVAFGTALIVSALVVWLGVIALMSSGRDNDRCGHLSLVFGLLEAVGLRVEGAVRG
jgi:hypothetical protein